LDGKLATLDDTEIPSENSILENATLNYRKLGLSRNPFESLPVFSELEPVPFDGYLKYYVQRLSDAVNNAPKYRPASVYLVGPSGSGKSAILKNFSQRIYRRAGIYPIYLRFPLSGGKLALYNEFFRRLPIPLLKLLFLYAKDNYSSVGTTYIGRKLYIASMNKSIQKSCESITGISPQYVTESISDILTTILDITDSTRIALVLDEFEHAWSRFTGAQKYNWERSLAELFLRVGSKAILILPVLPKSIAMGSRPYMNMYPWKEIDLDLILGATPKNVVEINCREVTLMRCAYSIINRCVINKQGEHLCEFLLSTLGSYSTIGEVILDMHDRILKMAIGRDD
jgi:GTPase SAR1 family protein